MRYLISLLLIVFTNVLYAQTLEELKQQRIQAEKEIQYTNKLLQTTEKSKKSSLNKITIISKQINNRQSIINSINRELSLIDRNIVEKTNNIKTLEYQIEELKGEYEKAIYHTWRTKNTHNRMMYVFSGKDIGEVYRRMRYLHEFSNFRKQQGQLLLVMQSNVEKEIGKLAEEKKAKLDLLNAKKNESSKLQKEQYKQDAYVKELHKKEVSLKKQLAQQQQKRNKLLKVIEKIIADAVKESNAGDSKASRFKLTPEEKIVSDQFEKNRGHLPWPVEQGIVISKYGVHRHEVEKTIKIDNPGIDIQTEENSEARAVFNGIVTGLYALPMYHFGVIVRHGEYLSFYCNLSEVYVKEGDKVSTKQALGKIHTDSESGKTFMHFEVWKGTTKNNPIYWIAR